jgi:hypothetical protein
MKKLLLYSTVLIGLGLLCHAPAVLAWGDDGHQIVGRIAARKLTAKAKRQIVAMLRQGGDDSLHIPMLLGAPDDPQPTLTAISEALGRIATWPDHMLGGKGNTAPWHFVDYGLFEGPNTTANRCVSGCVVEEITALIANIRANTPISVVEEPGVTRTFAVDKELRFLIHLFGDIHQPLHASTNADAGGNCEKATGFTGSTNLHAVWDTAIVKLVMKPTLDGTANALLNEFQSNVLAAGVVDPQQIAAESFALAKDEIYPEIKPAAIPIIDHFVDVTPSECSVKAPAEIRSASVDGPASFNNATNTLVVREQLFKAGVRLATVLNSLFM